VEALEGTVNSATHSAKEIAQQLKELVEKS
jgi:hypothetical protein